MYLSQIAKIFVSNNKCICLELQMYLARIANVFGSNCKMYLSRIAKCICLELPNVFVQNCQMYSSQIAKCICLKLQNVFVSNCNMYWSKRSNLHPSLRNDIARGGQTHVQKICRKFCMILKAFWQHKIDIKRLLRVEMSQFGGKMYKFQGKFDIVSTDLRIFSCPEQLNR